MIELIRDRLHIIRNSVDHGMAAGGSAGGRQAGQRAALVSARRAGTRSSSRSRRRARYRRRAHRRKGARTQVADRCADRAMDDAANVWIFENGLSNATRSPISGRGVGMDVVRANISRPAADRVDQPGKGLRIVIHVPLTLSILSTIIVGVGTQRFALARRSIGDRQVRGDQVRIDAIGDAVAVSVRGRPECR